MQFLSRTSHHVTATGVEGRALLHEFGPIHLHRGPIVYYSLHIPHRVKSFFEYCLLVAVSLMSSGESTRQFIALLSPSLLSDIHHLYPKSCNCASTSADRASASNSESSSPEIDSISCRSISKSYFRASRVSSSATNPDACVS
jgi:hypothetical protein